jgi:hypothetical protein
METKEQNNAPTLLAIPIATRRSGDRELERYARGRLRDQHGVRLSFAKPADDREGQQR